MLVKSQGIVGADRRLHGVCECWLHHTGSDAPTDVSRSVPLVRHGDSVVEGQPAAQQRRGDVVWRLAKSGRVAVDQQRALPRVVLDAAATCTVKSRQGVGGRSGEMRVRRWASDKPGPGNEVAGMQGGWIWRQTVQLAEAQSPCHAGARTSTSQPKCTHRGFPSASQHRGPQPAALPPCPAAGGGEGRGGACSFFAQGAGRAPP